MISSSAHGKGGQTSALSRAQPPITKHNHKPPPTPEKGTESAYIGAPLRIKTFQKQQSATPEKTFGDFAKTPPGSRFGKKCVFSWKRGQVMNFLDWNRLFLVCWSYDTIRALKIRVEGENKSPVPVFSGSKTRMRAYLETI